VDDAGGTGLFDEFRGYRIPDEAEMERALRDALVVVDANVLLNLYRYHDTTRDDLLDLLDRIGDRLFVPHQVLREFWRNRLHVLARRDAGRDQAVAAFAEQRRATLDAIVTWARSTAVEAAVRDELVGRVDVLHKQLSEGVLGRTPEPVDVVGGAMGEPVIVRLEPLLDGRTGRYPGPEVWAEQVAEGRARVARSEPPGYLDADKADSPYPEGPAGDYLVWRQSVEQARQRGLDLLFVTGDEKADWWWRHGPELLGPRQELVAEFARDCGGRQLYMMRPMDLLSRAAALRVDVRDGSVEDAGRVGRETARPRWSARGAALLLDRLDDEGWSHAAVIRAAAASDGFVDRETVYELCGFDGDRMLRGFTRPATRITGDLQEAGVVEHGVEVPLCAVYAGGVTAVGFRIPEEMVALLDGDGGDGDGNGGGGLTAAG
jgi:predicted nucleic acid-binding protein